MTVNIQIMRAFVALRESLAGYAELKINLEKLESKYDDQFKVIFDVIKSMIWEDQEKEPHTLGFRVE